MNFKDVLKMHKAAVSDARPVVRFARKLKAELEGSGYIAVPGSVFLDLGGCAKGLAKAAEASIGKLSEIYPFIYEEDDSGRVFYHTDFGAFFIAQLADREGLDIHGSQDMLDAATDGLLKWLLEYDALYETMEWHLENHKAHCLRGLLSQTVFGILKLTVSGYLNNGY